MKLQSAIEFLSTYGFVFVVLTAVIAVVVFVATSAQSTLTNQCASFGGFACTYSSFYSNLTNGYSLATFALSSSQSVPLNISNFSITIGASTFNGLCTPTLLYPGSMAVCSAATKTSNPIGIFLKGYYAIGAKYCNNGVGLLSQNKCVQPVTYTGTFLSEVAATQSVPFGVNVGLSTNTVNFPAFSAITPPLLPTNYTLVQNGEWETNGSAGSFLYSYASSVYLGANYLGTNAMLFPLSTPMLSTASACIPSTYPLISTAFTTLYVYNTQNSEKIETSNAMEVFYKPLGATTWNSVYGGAAWSQHALNGYSASVSLTRGLYSIDAVWYTPCGPALQALNVS